MGRCPSQILIGRGGQSLPAVLLAGCRPDLAHAAGSEASDHCRGVDQHFSPTALVCLETSHNRWAMLLCHWEHWQSVLHLRRVSSPRRRQACPTCMRSAVLKEVRQAWSQLHCQCLWQLEWNPTAAMQAQVD